MNNENKDFFNNDVETTNINEEEIILAPPLELIEGAKEIAQNTISDEKFSFALHYDTNQKEFLLSMLETVGAIVENDDEEGYILATTMNMTQLAFIKRLDCVERVKTEEDSNSQRKEEIEKLNSNAKAPFENVALHTDKAMQTEQVMTIATDEVVAVADEAVTANADDGIAVACVGGSSSSCCCPSNTNMESAKVIQVESFVSGRICCPGAEQWFKFTAPQTKQYTIYTSGSLDTVGTLYDCCGKCIVTEDDINGKINFRIVRTLTAGATYYVRVRLANNDTGNYTIKVTDTIFIESLNINRSSVTLQKGVLYELPTRCNYTYKGYRGAKPIPGLAVYFHPSTAKDREIWWNSSIGDVLECSYGWDDDGDKFMHVTAKEIGTANLYAEVYSETRKYDVCAVTVITPYETMLKELCGFSSQETSLILKLYNKIESIFSSEITILKAWRCARLLSEFCYDNISYGIINKWDNVAGSVTTNENRKTYFINTLGYTESEFNALQYGLLGNKDNADKKHNIIDFTHMQYALAARLAYTLDKDKLASNLLSGLYTGNYGIYTDEEISYLGGWLGDAVLTKIYGQGTTAMKNEDYMADLDAENIYRLIIQGKSSINALNEYYSDMTSSNTRANIFLQYIPYSTVKQKIFYELVDAQLYMFMSNASNQGNTVLVNYYLNLINDEQYHFETIKTNHPDTYNFLKSLEDGCMTMGEYT